jgi:cold shock CspA family protein
MRFEGTLKSWNDERGFGFIAPIQGGQEVFVHIRAFGARSGRPQVNLFVSFEVEVGPQGKKRAKNVEPARAARSQPYRRQESPAQWGTATLFASQRSSSSMA